MEFLALDFPSDAKRVWDLPVPIITNDYRTTVYLTDEITDPGTYNELIHKLREATPEDLFVLVINTPGGDLDTATSLISAIKNSYANVTAHLTGTVASAGTLIAMACDHLVVDDHTKFMIHTYSTGIQGKGNEVKAQQDFMNVAIKELLEEVYAGFLTEEELKELIDGKDFWFNKTQVLERWGNKA